VFESAREKELVYVFKTVYEGPFQRNEETEDGRFWSLDEIKSQIGKGLFTPNFEQEFRRLGF
jgi:hypothetical protein